MRLAPKRADNQPDSGMTAAWASMYPVMTHCSRLRSLLRTRPSVGKATFTTVLSRMTMKVPRMMAMRGIRMVRELGTGESAIASLRRFRAPFYFNRSASDSPGAAEIVGRAASWPALAFPDMDIVTTFDGAANAAFVVANG